MRRSDGLRMGVVLAVALVAEAWAAEAAGATLTARSLTANGDQNGRTIYRDGLNASVGQLAVQDQARSAKVLGLRDLEVDVEPSGLMVRTTVKHVFYNESDDTLEGVFTFPLAPQAAVDRFAMTIQSETDLMESTLVDREQAKAIYRDIVYGYRRDPGVLEMLDMCTFRATIFPIPPRRTKTIVISYITPLDEQVASDGTSEWVYRYPLIGSTGHPDALPPAVNLRLRMKLPHVMPAKDIRVSLNMQAQSDGKDGLLLGTALKGEAVGDDWMVSWPKRAEEDAMVAGCVVQAHRSSEDGPGTFLLRIGLPAEVRTGDEPSPRDVVVLWDTSASRTENELAAGRSAILSLLSALNGQDRFALVAFDSETRLFAPALASPALGTLVRVRAFLARQRPLGATDIGGAFGALRDLFPGGTASGPCVVYIGDGRATQGLKGDELKSAVASSLGDMHAELYALWPGQGVEKSGDSLTELEKLTQRLPICLQEAIAADNLGATMRQAFDHPVSRARISLTFADGSTLCPANGRWVKGQCGRMIEVSGPYSVDGPATVNLVGWPGAEERAFTWNVSLPKDEPGNASVARWLGQREALALSARGDVAAARSCAMRHHVLSPETAFLVLESEEMYREFRVQRGANDGESLKDVRSSLLAGTSVPPSGIDQAEAPSWLGQVAPAEEGRDATRLSEVEIDGTYVQISLNQVAVPLQQGGRLARLSPAEAMARRVQLGRQLAERRGLPFEPETVLPQIWLSSLADAIQRPERLAERFAPGADDALWRIWASQPQPQPATQAANTGTRQRRDVDAHLPVWAEMLMVRMPSRFKRIADGRSIDLDSHQLAHQLFTTVLYGLNPNWVKSNSEAEVRRAIRTRMRRSYDLRNVPPERLSAAWNLLAELALIEGDPRSAVEAVDHVSPVSQGDEPRLTTLLKALACAEQADCKRASTCWQQLLAMTPPVVEHVPDVLAQAYYGSAILCGDSVQMTEAVERFGRVRMPQSPRLYQDLARMFVVQNRMDEALRAARSIQEFRPDLEGRAMTLQELLAVKSE